MKALIIVDMQNDFTEGGALAVKGGNQLADRLAGYARWNTNSYDVQVTTQDWHITPGDHFKMWPVHCVAGTDGAKLKPQILLLGLRNFRKGMREGAYSGFDGMDDYGNRLQWYLDFAGIDEVDIVGIATDYCVMETALSAVGIGYKTNVLGEYCVAVNETETKWVYQNLRDAGANIVLTAPRQGAIIG